MICEISSDLQINQSVHNRTFLRHLIINSELFLPVKRYKKLFRYKLVCQTIPLSTVCFHSFEVQRFPAKLV